MSAETSLLVPFLNRAADFNPAEWFQLVPKGQFKITRKEGDKVRAYVQVVDDTACERIVQAFTNRQAAVPGYRMLIDFEHFSHDTGKSSEAACWVEEMQVRPDGVWAKGEWSDTGAAAIKNRRYRFLSPVWFPRQTEQLGGNRFRPIEVNDAGLTNKPNLGDALQPFWNRAEDFHGREATTTENPNMQKLIALLGLAATATEDDIVAKVQAFKNRVTELEPLQGTLTTLQGEHTALKNRHNALLNEAVTRTLDEHKDVITPDAREAWKNRLTEDFAGTSLLLKGLKPAAAPDTRIDDALKTYEGVITAESKPAWKNRLAADYDGTVALLKGIKSPGKKAPVHQGGGGKGRSETTTTEDDGVAAFMNRVSEVMTEQKLDQPAAIAAVAGSEPELYDAYRAGVTGRDQGGE